MITFVPAVRPQQALSSWILQLASNHGAKPHTFCAMIWPGHEFWTRDIDRTISDRTLKAISKATHVSIAEIESMTLRSMIDLARLPSAHGVQPGILPVGIYHRKRHLHGQQFCAGCLDEKVPYLRLLWRSEFVVACNHHGFLLRDACPHCGAAFVPHRHHALKGKRCHGCLKSLLAGSDPKPSSRLLTLQTQVLMLLGIKLEPDHSIPRESDSAALKHVFSNAGPEALQGIRQLCRVRSRQLHEAGAFPEFISWSRLRTAERTLVLESIASDLDDWPGRWVASALQSGLTQLFLLREFGRWPHWTAGARGQLPYSHGPYGMTRQRTNLDIPVVRKVSDNKVEYRNFRQELVLQKLESKGSRRR